MDDPFVRKTLTFVAVVCIACAISLGIGRVKAWETFLPSFSNGQEIVKVQEIGQGQALVYKVQSGDKWWTIARDHGVSTRALLEANGANVGVELVPGQNIHLPGASGPVAAPSASSRPR